ncbi:MAG: hypothetical protein GY765_12635, partial [bacterium]|nr:hypothetical protein [bacterium]
LNINKETIAILTFGELEPIKAGCPTQTKLVKFGGNCDVPKILSPSSKQPMYADGPTSG